MLGASLQILLTGLVVGGLARFAVPGPDPMPIWLTVTIGIAGSIIGGATAAAIFGAEQDQGSVFAILLGSILAGSLLVMAYRRFVQKRPITGPDAHRPPTRSGGTGLGSIFGSPAKRAYQREETMEDIRKLGELRDSGAISEDEFERKKAELLARI